MSTPLDEYEFEMNAHNDRQRTRLAAYLAAHGRAWIGKVNIYPPARSIWRNCRRYARKLEVI